MTMRRNYVVHDAAPIWLLAILIFLAAFAPGAFAADDAARMAAAGKALDRLYRTQRPNGSWESAGQGTAATSAAAFAMLSQRKFWGEKAEVYQEATERAMEYIVRHATLQNAGNRADGAKICPEASAICAGVYWYDGTNSTVATGLAAAAIATHATTAGLGSVATRAGPLAGMTWASVLQGITNMLSASQIVSGNAGAGGWGAVLPGDASESVTATRWALLALVYSESVGSETPSATKSELTRRTGMIRDADRAVCGDSSPSECDFGGKGGWLLAMRYSGFDVSNAEVRAALTWLDTHWAAGAGGAASAGDDSIFALYAGLESALGVQSADSIRNKDLQCEEASSSSPGATDCNWWGDLSGRLIASQRGDGGWGALAGADEVLATALNAAVLGGAHIPLERIACPSDEAFWMSRWNAWPTAEVALGSKQYSPKEIAALSRDGMGTGGVSRDIGSALARALAAAKLNVLRGSDATPVSPSIAAAGQLLREAAGKSPLEMEPASILGAKMAEAYAALDSYNRGLLTAGCAVSGAPVISSGDGKGAAGDSIAPIYRAASAPASFSPRTLGRIRLRQRNGVTAIAVSADGGTIATAGADRKIRIWEASTGRQKQVLRGTLGLPSGLALSADGMTLCSASSDSEIRFWNLQTARETGKLRGNEHGIRALAMSADGAKLASAGDETRILIWDLASRKLSKILYGPTDFVNSAAFSPDGSMLAVGDESSRVLIFRLAGGGAARSLLGHAGPVDAVSFSPDGRLLASSGEDGTILLWDARTGKRQSTLRTTGSAVRTISFSPDGKLLASGGEDGRVLLWRTDSGSLDRELPGAGGAVNALLFSGNGNNLLGADQTGELAVWNTATNGKFQTIRVPNEPEPISAIGDSRPTPTNQN